MDSRPRSRRWVASRVSAGELSRRSKDGPSAREGGRRGRSGRAISGRRGRSIAKAKRERDEQQQSGGGAAPHQRRGGASRVPRRGAGVVVAEQWSGAARGGGSRSPMAMDGGQATLPSQHGTAGRCGGRRTRPTVGPGILAVLDGSKSSRGELDHQANSIVGIVRFKTNLTLPSVTEARFLSLPPKILDFIFLPGESQPSLRHHRIGGSAQLFQL